MQKTLDRSPMICITTLCVLYMAQGMPDGFVKIGLKTYLIDRGVSTAQIGTIVALVSWPWALKWIWGPIIDRFQFHRMGRRRPWILAAQTGIMLTLGMMLITPDLSSNLMLLSITILLANIFASIQDVSVDAMAIDQLPAEKRGIANGMMYGSSYLGSYIGSFVLGGLLLSRGIVSAVTVQILILFAIALFPFLFREKSSDAVFAMGTHGSDGKGERHVSIRQLFMKLGKAFSVRSSWLAALLAISSLIVTNAYLIVWPVYLQESLGWTGEEYLYLEGGLSTWFGLGGSVIGGFIASAIGSKRAVLSALLLLSLTWLIHWLIAADWDNRTLVTSLFLQSTILAGFMQVSMFAMFMEIAWPPVAATQFTAYMAMLNFSNGIGALLAGDLEASFSMKECFLVFTVLQLVCVGILLFIDPSQTRRSLD